MQARKAWIFLAPALIAVFAVGFYPLLQTFYYSFTDAPRDFIYDPSFIWFRNYAELFSDGDFLHSILNTIIFAVSSVSLEFVLGLAFALVINSQFKGRHLVRAAVLIPWALPTVVAAKMWAWMLNDNFGVINDLLFRKFGLLSEPIAWTGRDGFAMLSIVMVDVWKTTPFVALLLLAGLQLIPADLYEAADVDGASAPQQFFTITLPLLKPAILVALIFRSLDALRVFDVIWVMTGGRFGTESMATYNYRVLFNNLRLGFSSAVSVIIFLVIALFVVIYVKSVRLEEDQ